MTELTTALNGGKYQLGRARQVAASDAQSQTRERRTAAESPLDKPFLRPLAAHCRIRSSMRSRASNTPGIDSKARSTAPMS